MTRRQVSAGHRKVGREWLDRFPYGAWSYRGKHVIVDGMLRVVKESGRTYDPFRDYYFPEASRLAEKGRASLYLRFANLMKAPKLERGRGDVHFRARILYAETQDMSPLRDWRVPTDAEILRFVDRYGLPNCPMDEPREYPVSWFLEDLRHLHARIGISAAIAPVDKDAIARAGTGWIKAVRDAVARVDERAVAAHLRTLEAAHRARLRRPNYADQGPIVWAVANQRYCLAYSDKSLPGAGVALSFSAAFPYVMTDLGEDDELGDHAALQAVVGRVAHIADPFDAARKTIAHPEQPPVRGAVTALAESLLTAFAEGYRRMPGFRHRLPGPFESRTERRDCQSLWVAMNVMWSEDYLGGPRVERCANRYCAHDPYFFPSRVDKAYCCDLCMRSALRRRARSTKPGELL